MNIAIAVMDMAQDDPVPHAVRDAYPELANMFDRVDDMNAEPPVEMCEAQERDDALDKLDSVIDAVATARDLLMVVAQMDGAKDVADLIGDVIRKLDAEVCNHG